MPPNWARSTPDPALPKSIDVFTTDASGSVVLPEKLPLGRYRMVELEGVSGYYNEWADQESCWFDFAISTDRAYEANGDVNEDGQDTLVISEPYANHETLAPTAQGYVCSEGVPFVVEPVGTIQTVEMRDDYTKLEISKQDLVNGRELAGAVLTIRDSRGNVVDRWVSSDAAHTVAVLSAQTPAKPFPQTGF